MPIEIAANNNKLIDHTDFGYPLSQSGYFYCTLQRDSKMIKVFKEQGNPASTVRSEKGID